VIYFGTPILMAHKIANSIPTFYFSNDFRLFRYKPSEFSKISEELIGLPHIFARFFFYKIGVGSTYTSTSMQIADELIQNVITFAAA